MVVIHSYMDGYGGLGDVLRSMFCYYVFCKLNDIEYYLHFQQSSLKECFDNKADDSLIDVELKTFFQIGGIYDNKTLGFLETLKNNKKDNINDNYVIYSNVYGFVSNADMVKYRKSFIDFLKFSTAVLERANFLENTIKGSGELSISYISIHIRCGDKYMNDKAVPSDERMCPDKVEEMLRKLVNSLDKTKKICIFTDNDGIKNTILSKQFLFFQNFVLPENIFTFDTKIRRVVSDKQNQTDINLINGIIDAVAEFILLSNSEIIYSMSESGFSYWASFLYDIPYYVMK